MTDGNSEGLGASAVRPPTTEDCSITITGHGADFDPSTLLYPSRETTARSFRRELPPEFSVRALPYDAPG
jgi:hypothetical protein